MKIRVKFTKEGDLKFIGHLDVMRFFQKVLRRAEVVICYSAGFSPHQIMSFSAPLSLGLTSEGEYMDMVRFLAQIGFEEIKIGFSPREEE